MRTISNILIFSLLIFGTSCFAKVIDIKSGEVQAAKHYIFDTIHLNLEELTNEARTVFSGTCIEVNEIEKDKLAKLPVIEYTFKIDEGIKGVKNKKKIKFRQWKATVKNGGYVLGEKYVLFLHGNSELALTSPVGFLQGQFQIFEDNGSKVVKNKIGNFGLVENPRTRRKLSLKDKSLVKYLESRSLSGEAIGYEQFVTAVKSLVKEQ